MMLTTEEQRFIYDFISLFINPFFNLYMNKLK